MIKAIEIIEANRDSLVREIADLYRYVLETDGLVMYRVYIWEDGEIERLLDTSSSNSWLQAKESESRQLFHVVDIEDPFFDWTNYCSDHVPDKDEDPMAYEALRVETIDWLCSEYDADDVIDTAIDKIRRDAELDDLM